MNDDWDEVNLFLLSTKPQMLPVGDLITLY